MMTSFLRIGFGAAVALSLLGGAAVAADENPEAAIIKACKVEYAKYASRAKKGTVKATLLKHADKLSAECKAALDASN
jgi:hypothetical protein